MAPFHAYQGSSLQPENEMEWSDEVLLFAAALLLILMFGLLLILHSNWETLMEVLQGRDAPEPHLSVEETNPLLGPYIPTYD
ncbi:hypothetical protein COCON_G00061120 [Conger conger]|uniref:Uncharacterized protein n=1 Tax=Conger conger TaxID=82655 RepID=A0A9Q1DRG9_CONCO|nr:hypothetical protein COCON_G00061120 [Conger conger]